MKIIKIIKDNHYTLALVLTIFISIFSIKSIPYFIILLIILWLVKHKDFSNISSNFKWLKPFYFYALVILISFFFAENYSSALKILERYASFIILPTIIFCKKWSQKELRFFAYFFVKITLLISIFSIVNLLYFYFTHSEFVNRMDETYLQWKLPHLNGFHPTYFGFLIVVANIMLLKNSPKDNFFKNKNFYQSVFLSLFLLYLSPRTPSICLVLVWSYHIYAFFKKKSYSRYYFFILIVLGILFFSVAIFSSQYLTDKILNSFQDKRIQLWQKSFSLIKENYFIFGEGLGNGQILLENYIVNNKLNQYKVFDLHNQYLMNYLDLGIFGFFALLWLIYKPLYSLKDKTLFLFCITFSLSIFTESYLYVIKGIIMFIILISYFIISSDNFKLEESTI